MLMKNLLHREYTLTLSNVSRHKTAILDFQEIFLRRLQKGGRVEARPVFSGWSVMPCP
jgi:hypothetical protein